MLAKNANQLWKEYRKNGGTLSFAKWIDREKEKFVSADGVNDDKNLFILNAPLNKAITDMHKTGGIKPELSNTHTLGVNNKLLYAVGGVIAIVAVVYLLKKINLQQ